MAKKVSLNELKTKMGDEVVKKLYDNFAGRIIYISKKGINFTSQEAKEKYIINLYYDSGYSIKKIAEKVNLSEDRIRKIIYKNINKL